MIGLRICSWAAVTTLSQPLIIHSFSSPKPLFQRTRSQSHHSHTARRRVTESQRRHASLRVRQQPRVPRQPLRVLTPTSFPFGAQHSSDHRLVATSESTRNITSDHRLAPSLDSSVVKQHCQRTPCMDLSPPTLLSWRRSPTPSVVCVFRLGF